MKLIAIITLAISLNSNASCIGEAQFIGQVSKLQKTTTSCKATLTLNSFIQSSAVCPLNDSRLFVEGFEIGLNSEKECNFNAGDDISGVIVDNGTQLILE